MKSPLKPIRRLIRKIFILLVIPGIILFTVFISPEKSEAANGGRIGGGDFRPPSIPQSSSYRSNPRGYGNYRGGIGFPFMFPLLGFGSGGLFGFLILMAISGIIVNTLRGTNELTSTSFNSKEDVQPSTNPATMIQLQIGLLASAKKIQKDLRKLANTADTSDKDGLQTVLQETTLALLRQPELWAYGNIEMGTVPFNSAESTFNRLSLNERSKLNAEITSNYSGKINVNGTAEQKAGTSNAINEFIAVTILVAAINNQSINHQELIESVKVIGSISANDLIALEVIWQPEGEGDSLDKEELLTKYPNLKYL